MGTVREKNPKKKIKFPQRNREGGRRERRRPGLPWSRSPWARLSHWPHQARGQVTAHHSQFPGAALILEFRWDFLVLISLGQLNILWTFKLFVLERVSLRWYLFSWAGLEPEKGCEDCGICVGHLSPPPFSPPSPLLFAFSLCCSSCSALPLPPI